MPVGVDYTQPFTCGTCGTAQRFYYGDPADITAPDVNSVRCHACKTVECIDPDGKRFGMFEGDGHTEDGIPHGG